MIQNENGATEKISVDEPKLRPVSDEDLIKLRKVERRKVSKFLLNLLMY